jgi:hypothetical protein
VTDSQLVELVDALVGEQEAAETTVAQSIPATVPAASTAVVVAPNAKTTAVDPATEVVDVSDVNANDDSVIIISPERPRVHSSTVKKGM